jgi:hypothetical protein
MITEARAKQFQMLYENETGEKLTLEQAFEHAERLVEMIRVVYRPIKKSALEKETKDGIV